MAVLMREEGASSHDSLLAEIFTASETECINISCGRSSQHVDGIVEAFLNSSRPMGTKLVCISQPLKFLSNTLWSKAYVDLLPCPTCSSPFSKLFHVEHHFSALRLNVDFKLEAAVLGRAKRNISSIEISQSSKPDMLKELPAVRRGRSNISFDNLGLIMSFLDRVVVEKCELVCRSWRSCVSRHSSALPLHRIWLSKQACREKQGSCDVFIDMINYSSEYSLDEDDRHIDGCSIALSLAWNVRRRLKDSFIVTFKADDDGGIGCDSQSMPNEWCRNLLSTITCGIGELFITLSGAGNVSILQHLSHFINRSSTKRIVLDTWRHSSEILPWITSPDFYLSDAAQTAKSLRVQFNWEVRRFVGPIDASSAWSQLYYALPEMDELDVCIASYDDRVTSWAMSNLPGRIVQAEETVKAPRLIVRLNAGNWRFCMPPPRQHHIGVKVPRWDFAATDDDQVHDGHVH